jgi:hypothetical protein
MSAAVHTAGRTPSDMILRFENWPAADQALWHAGTTPTQGLRRRRHADRLSSRSIQAAWQGYGRFLAVLKQYDQHHLLAEERSPAERVNFESVALFFDALRAAGNVDNTIKARLFHLRTALHIMVPKADFDWLTQPDGQSLDSLLKQELDDEASPPSATALFQWGLELMPDTPLPGAQTPRLKFCRNYRNGLIIALLACRAPRVGSLAAMRLGKNLYKLNGEYWVRLQSSIVKNKRELEYSLPGELTLLIDRYLVEIRPLLIDAGRDDAVWGNGDGGRFTYRSIETMIFRQTGRRFAQAFGPHLFRHAFASALARHDPNNPGLAAVILGISEGVVHEHYRRARQADAAVKFQACLRQDRERQQPRRISEHAKERAKQALRE